MNTLIDVTVGARAPWSGTVPANGTITITDLGGNQAVDFLCYDARDRIVDALAARHRAAAPPASGPLDPALVP